MKPITVSSAMLKALEALPDAKPGARGTKWTEEMDEVIKQGWHRKKHYDIAKLLGLHENTCLKRAKELGIA